MNAAANSDLTLGVKQSTTFDHFFFNFLAPIYFVAAFELTAFFFLDISVIMKEEQ